MQQIAIHTEFIQLGQVLKLKDYISSGGEAKVFLENNSVFVNGDRETRRGRKLYHGDTVTIGAEKYTVTKS
ncbi:S4 domain-containing protein YaaA [Alicyclobacillus ferrooxydans]|uniref:RNA-binding protein n=1 Tax=Alicyclobacillus ferrooxydans TaxID=471514 RepID=A0A0P9CSC2_9BACL|nr:S4 domain-containing protein YaaA [Alicyclobacillus ferrooxydans]KPV42511.1 RNA-binding protein [Alicyclobacillus ferrooxydans]